jgi:hypothetical protein
MRDFRLFHAFTKIIRYLSTSLLICLSIPVFRKTKAQTLMDNTQLEGRPRVQKTKTIIPLLLFIGVLAFAMIPNTMATLPNGYGIQKFNEHIHIHEPAYYTRGHYYNPWYPELCSGPIKVGTWLTIGWGGVFEVPEEELEDAIAFWIAWIKANPVSLTFDGEEIYSEESWRFDDVIIIPLGDGMYYFQIPFRYYIPPRAVGYYEIVLDFGVGPVAGYVEWVPPNQL